MNKYNLRNKEGKHNYSEKYNYVTSYTGNTQFLITRMPLFRIIKTMFL